MCFIWLKHDVWHTTNGNRGSVYFSDPRFTIRHDVSLKGGVICKVCMIQVTGVIAHNAEKNATRVKGHCVGKCLWMVQIMIVTGPQGVVKVISIIIISSFIRRYPK